MKLPHNQTLGYLLEATPQERVRAAISGINRATLSLMSPESDFEMMKDQMNHLLLNQTGKDFLNHVLNYPSWVAENVPEDLSAPYHVHLKDVAALLYLQGFKFLKAAYSQVGKVLETQDGSGE